MTIHYVDVFLPGPWWNALTYRAENPIREGVRVLAPVGRGVRVGFACPSSTPPRNIEIRNLKEVLDDVPPLGEDLWLLARWLSRRALCGFGAALAHFAPAPLLRGEKVDPMPSILRRAGLFEERILFDVDERLRWCEYEDELQRIEGFQLLLFPEQASARRFWEQLPQPMRAEGLLWPSRAGKDRWEAWKRVRSGEIRRIVGSPAALFAPFPSLSLVIVEEEGHGGYQTLGTPFFYGRSVAAERARLASARLVIGGSLPSARLYRSRRPLISKPPKGKVRFVDLRAVPGAVLQGVRDPLKISEPLLEETLAVVNRGKRALWILDRKGFAGEVACEECGSPLLCRRCGTLYRLSRRELYCPVCRERMPLPESCPCCGGRLLQGSRPGLEALELIASALAGGDVPVRIWQADLVGAEKYGGSERGREGGSVIVGSRGALSFCDEGNVALVGWIDADAEARKPFFDARYHAFRMVWESCWRGPGSADRQVLLQSRVPGKGWQQGLIWGWDRFWEAELREREALALPPFSALVEIKGGRQTAALVKALRQGGLEPFEGEEAESPLWLSCRRLSQLRALLEPFFDIGRSRRGFPKLRIWTD